MDVFVEREHHYFFATFITQKVNTSHFIGLYHRNDIKFYDDIWCSINRHFKSIQFDFNRELKMMNCNKPISKCSTSIDLLTHKIPFFLRFMNVPYSESVF